jgi:hypothetical protein
MVTPKSGVRPRTSPPAHPPPGGWVALWGAGGDRAPWTPSESAGTPGLALLLPTGRARVRAQCSIARVRLRPPAQVCAAPGASRQTLAEHVPRLFARRDRTPMPRSAQGQPKWVQLPARRDRSGLGTLARHDSTSLPQEAKARGGRAWRPMCVPPVARRARGGMPLRCVVRASQMPSPGSGPRIAWCESNFCALAQVVANPRAAVGPQTALARRAGQTSAAPPLRAACPPAQRGAGPACAARPAPARLDPACAA